MPFEQNPRLLYATFVNDIYGHVYGDKALKSLADSMKAFFPSDALLGRNGGDEFCILLKNHSYENVKEKLQQFTMAPKTFSYKGKEHPFYISLGYSEYPTFASNRSQLMRCADAALYEIKLHGKNGCMAYREGLELRARTHPYHFFTTIWTFHADLPPISSDKISHYRDRYLIHVKRL